MSERTDRQPWRTQGRGPDHTDLGSDLPEPLGLWLEAGPSYLPASTRQAIFAGVRVTRQAHREAFLVGMARRRATRARWIGLAAALMGLIALGAILSTAGRPTVQELPAVGPVAPEASAAPDHVANFTLPFTYRLPPGTGLEGGRADAEMYRWSLPEGSTAAVPERTFVLLALNERYVDPCDASMGIALLKGGPAGVVAYLQSIRGLKTSTPASATVDGGSARQLVIQLAPTADCPVVRAWPERELPFNDDVPEGRVGRFAITEVAGRLVAIGAITLASDMDAFARTADAFVASLRFDANHPGTAQPARTYVPRSSAASVGPGRLGIAAASSGSADGDQLLSQQDVATQRLIADTHGVPPGTAVNMVATVNGSASVLIGLPAAGKIVELDRATGEEIGHVILSRRVITSVAWARPLDEGGYGGEVWIGEPDVIERAGLGKDSAGAVFGRIRLWDGATVIAMAESEPDDYYATDLWALAAHPCTLLHIDPQISQVLERLPLGGASCPQGRLAVSTEGVWVRTDRGVVLVTQDGP